MTTRKHRVREKNFTRKNRGLRPQLKRISSGSVLYAAKSYKGDEIIEHTREIDKKHGGKCHYDAITWFGSLQVAKLYSNYLTQVYKWRVFKPFSLVMVGHCNADFFEKVFREYSGNLHSFMTNNRVYNIRGNHEYLGMTENERCYYEFKFVFGYMTVGEQYRFLVLLEHFGLREYLYKILGAIKYFEIGGLRYSGKMYNRISFYELDKHVVMNVCKCLSGMGYEGLYQKKGTRSFWYPSFIPYSKNMEEYILFNPSRVLEYKED